MMKIYTKVIRRCKDCDKCDYTPRIFYRWHCNKKKRAITVDVDKYIADWCPLPDFKIERRPEIVCLCGSTKFKDLYKELNEKFTLEGKIVLTVGVFNCINIKNKRELDELHLQKILMADTVFVINPGNYIGESTRKEIEFAIKNDKKIKYLVSKIPLKYFPG